MESELKKMRACMVCSVVKTLDRFKSEGCDNCEGFLRLAGSDNRILDCTSSAFSGMIAMANPAKSWVARWQGIEKKKPGLYASKVIGRLPEDIEDEIQQLGISLPLAVSPPAR